MKENGSLQMTRDEFVRLITLTTIGTLACSAYSYDLGDRANESTNLISEQSLDEQMRERAAKARALSFEPARSPDKTKSYEDFMLERSAYVTSLALMHAGGYSTGLLGYQTAKDVKNFSVNLAKGFANSDPDLMYKAFTAEVPTTDFLKGFEAIGKDNTNRVGAGMALGAGAMALYPPIAIQMGVVALVGNGISFGSSFIKDDASKSLLNDRVIDIAKAIWNDPNASHIMTNGVKDVLRKSYGIDFGASLNEHKKYLPTDQQKYIDFYLQNKGLTPEQLKAREEANMRLLVDNVNFAFDNGIKEIKGYIEKKEKNKADREYIEREIQGGVYLATFLADKFIGGDAGRIVSTLASSAAQTYALIATLGSTGPIGIAAAAVVIVMNLAGLFGKQVSADQVILDAIKKVHQSIIDMHKEMRESFGIVIKNQEEMMKRIDAQFALLSEKQDKAILEIKSVREALEIDINEARNRAREQSTNEISAVLLSFQTELSKQRLGKKIDDSVIYRGIEKIEFYGTKLSKNGDFTRSSSAVPGWDAMKIKSVLSTTDWIDCFIGFLPVIVEKFAPSSKMTIPHNPLALGKGAYALASVYVMFPEYAKIFENGGSQHFSKDLLDAINNTRNAIKISTSTETLNQFKKNYLRVVSKTIDSAFDIADLAARKNNNIDGKRKISPAAAGPLNLVEMVDASANSIGDYFNNYNDYVCSLPYRPIRDGRFVTHNGTEPLWFEPQYVSPKKILWKGLDKENSAKTVNTAEYLTALSKFNVIRIQKGNEKKDKISYRWKLMPSRDGHIGTGYLTSTEQYSVSKITLLQEKTPNPVLGDGITNGWVESKWTDTKISVDENKYDPQPDMDSPKFRTISSDLLDSEYVGGSVMIFLEKLKDTANIVYNIRKDIILNIPRYIEDTASQLGVELESAALSLKYLAGISAYAQSGSVGTATEVFYGKVAGVNYFKKEENGEIDTKKAVPPLISTREELADIIRKVTNPDYIYHPDHLAKRADSRRELREFIKTETLVIVSQAFDEYRYSYFSERLQAFNLPELTIPEQMLRTAQFVVTSSKNKRRGSIWPE